MKPISATPQKGGRLMSAISDEGVGVYNYVVKRDWRRDKNREIRSEGHVLFCPKTFIADDVPSIPMPPTSDAITLVVMLRHPNGKMGVIVGTATTVWRYFGLEDPDYFAAGYIDDGYFLEEEAAWKQIGGGFASSARRWECETLDGYLILNNGVDLPVTYRITEDTVTPIYELRELGIASVGTIWIQNNHLLCADVRQIKEDKFSEIMTPINVGSISQPGIDSVNVKIKINSGVDGVAGNTITAESADFNSGAGFVGMEGSTIRTLDGYVVTIDSVVSATEATFVGTSILSEPPMRFFLPAADGSDFLLSSGDNLSGFDHPIIGLRLWLDSGESRNITGVSGENYAVDGDRPIPPGQCYLENILAYSRFDDYTYIDRYQNRVIQSLPGKPTRFGAVMYGTVTPTSNVVTLDYPVKSIGFTGGDITVTGMKNGNLTAGSVFFDGLRLMVAGNAVKNFYQDVTDAYDLAVEAESVANTIVLAVASTLAAAEKALADAEAELSEDQENVDLSKAVADAQAAVDDALEAKRLADENLTAATTAKEKAAESLAEEEEVEVQLTESIADFSRITDLQHDGAEILKAKVLKGFGVVFTTSSIFIARYNESIGSFLFDLIPIQEGSGLFYRNTPIVLNSDYVLYASETQWMTFDFTTRKPKTFTPFLLCENLFFGQADPDSVERVFTVDNAITGEVLVCFPSTTQDKCIRFDYNYETVSTSSAEYTAGANIIFPGTNRGAFVMGASNGNVLRYGLVSGGKVQQSGTASKTGLIVTRSSGVFSESHIGQTVEFADGQRFGILKLITSTSVEVCGSGNVSAQAFSIDPVCHHRLGVAYTSTMESGGDDFGVPSGEKLLDPYAVMLSRFSPNTQLLVTIRAGVNVNGLSDKFSFTVKPPRTMRPTLLSAYYIADRIEVSGINNPIELTGREFMIAARNSKHFSRRPE